MTIDRRAFMGSVAAAGLLATLGNFVTPQASRAATGAKIIVVGGGFGGTIAAKYIRKFYPASEVTLIEPNATFVTCPFSNTVIAGFNNMDFITHDYGTLSSSYGISVIQDTVSAINGSAGTVTLASGSSLNFDRLVLAPGVDFRADAIEGYSPTDRNFPHAWKGGEQTQLLRDQIRAMEDGGTIIIAPPERPFRAPPAPYERASLIAHYLQANKPASKVIILDSNNDFAKQELFEEGWEKLYPGMIEWVPRNDHGGITAFSAADREIITGSGNRFKGQVINIIPPQMAGRIAVRSDLTDTTGWCPVDPVSFKSASQSHIHIIGDSCIAGDMPKTGHSANSQAKICAAAIVSELTGHPMPDVTYSMAIYSLLSPRYGISMSEVYRLKDGAVTRVAGGDSELGAKKKTRRKEAEYADGWYKSITHDMFR